MPLLFFPLLLIIRLIPSYATGWPQKASNTMGYTVFNDNALDSLDINGIKHLVSDHGVICIKNTDNIQMDDLLRFASKFGDPIKLPSGFGFNTALNESYITNITNIDASGDVIQDVCTAEYLHSDGDFWENNYIYSLLYGDIIPNIGGNTHFIDLRLAHDHLHDHHKADVYDLIENKTVVIDVNDIPDFVNSVFLHVFNEKHGIAHHSIIDNHIVTHQPILYYAHKNALIGGLSKSESKDILYYIDDILMTNEEISYYHSWKPKDLVIWDNTAVIHRSAGGYKNNPRKLCRVQTRINID